MGLFLLHNDSFLQIGVWKINETIEELWNLTPNSVKTCYQKELAKFTSQRRQQEWLSARLLLTLLLNKPAVVEYKKDGKPYLKNSPLNISISHTKGYVAVAICKQSIGIDIEQYNTRIHHISERFLHPDEHPLPYAGNDTWGLLLYWSAKESVYKCMEHPNPDFRKLRLEDFIPASKGNTYMEELASGQQKKFNVNYLIAKDFVLTWAKTVYSERINNSLSTQ